MGNSSFKKTNSINEPIMDLILACSRRFHDVVRPFSRRLRIYQSISPPEFLWRMLTLLVLFKDGPT